MKGARRWVRHVAAVAIFALIASTAWVAIAPPASADSAGVSQLVSTLDGASNSLQSWTQGLGSVGKLADALPAVQTSAGSVLGFADLLHQTFNNGTKKLANAVDDSDLNITNQHTT